MALRPAYEIVLNALHAGREVVLGGYKIVIEDGELFRSGHQFSFETKVWEEVLFSFDVSFNWFSKECEKFSEEELFVLAGETALTKMARERADRRRALRAEPEQCNGPTHCGNPDCGADINGCGCHYSHCKAH